MDRKNTLLLTVIAVATLLVAVVGATFAYFTAQTGTGASANVTVTTSTSDSMEYGSFTPIVINANQQNFYKNAGSHQGTTTGDVKLKANAEQSATYCYTADVVVSANSLTHATVTEGETAPAELVLYIEKNSTAVSALTGLTKITDLTDHSICTNPNATDPDTPCSSKTTATVSGFDITEVEAGTINIPGNDTAGSVSVHKITAAANATATDSWTATVTLVNLDTDQNYNTNKTFSASLKFTPVDCTTGASTVPSP